MVVRRHMQPEPFFRDPRLDRDVLIRRLLSEKRHARDIDGEIRRAVVFAS